MDDLPGWSLQGVVLGQAGGGQALLGAPDGSQLPLAVGHGLASGWRLVALEPRVAHLERDGVALSLKLDNRAPALPADVPVEGPAAAGPVPVDDLRRHEAARVLLARLRAGTPESWLQLARQTRVEPVPAAAGLRGLRIHAADSPRVLSTLGLEPGDLLRRVNGTGFESVQQVGLRLMHVLRSSSEYELEIERRGKPLKIWLKAEQ